MSVRYSRTRSSSSRSTRSFATKTPPRSALGNLETGNPQEGRTATRCGRSAFSQVRPPFSAPYGFCQGPISTSGDRPSPQWDLTVYRLWTPISSAQQPTGTLVRSDECGSRGGGGECGAVVQERASFGEVGVLVHHHEAQPAAERRVLHWFHRAVPVLVFVELARHEHFVRADEAVVRDRERREVREQRAPRVVGWADESVGREAVGRRQHALEQLRVPRVVMTLTRERELHLGLGCGGDPTAEQLEAAQLEPTRRADPTGRLLERSGTHPRSVVSTRRTRHPDRGPSSAMAIAARITNAPTISTA